MGDLVITVEIDGKAQADLVKALDQVARDLGKSIDQAAPAVSKELMTSLQRVAQEMAKRHGNPYSSGLKGDDVLHVRSGAGLKSILDSVAVRGASFEALEGVISTGLLTIHETGGTIEASGGGYLTVPLPAALDSRGMPLRLSARDWPNTFVQKSKKGNLIIFQRQGREIIPLYVLKKSVTLKPRLGLEEAVYRELPFFLERAIDRMMDVLEATR